MKRAMTGKTLEELVGDIGDQTRPKKELQQGRLDQTESEIEELNRLRAELLEPVERNSKAYSAVADRIAEIDQTSTGLAYESLVAPKVPDCKSCSDTKFIIRGYDGRKIRCPRCRTTT